MRIQFKKNLLQFNLQPVTLLSTGLQILLKFVPRHHTVVYLLVKIMK